MIASQLVALPAIVGYKVGSVEETNINGECMPCEVWGTMELDLYGDICAWLLTCQHKITDQSIQVCHDPLRSSHPWSWIQASAMIQIICCICSTQP